MRFYKRKETVTELLNLEDLFLIEGEMRCSYDGEYFRNTRYYIAKADRDHYYDVFSGLKFKIHGQRNNNGEAEEPKDGIYAKQMVYLKDYAQEILDIGHFKRRIRSDSLYLTKAELYFALEKINAMSINNFDFFEMFSSPEE